MTEQEIQERNKQIALMLGWKNLNDDSFPEYINAFGDFYSLKELKFHSDWNWLMEAIQFLQKRFESKGMVWTSIQRYPLFTDIETVFIMVSDFSKHYNEGKL